MEAHRDEHGGATEMQRDRFPTLIEVLNRHTQAPVDLFSFYVFMRDQQRSVDYLDFWLDVTQHMALCRHFVRELRRSVLFETPDLDKAGSKRSSQVLEHFDSSEAGPAGSMRSGQTQDQRLSAFLRSNSPSHHSQKHSEDSSKSRDTTPGTERPPRPSFMTSNLGERSSPGDHSTPQHTVAREDIRASAEKILYTYLLQGSEREIILPQGTLLQITEAIEEQARDDPEVFDEGKEYVFQAMERDAFEGFIRAKGFGNLVPASLLIRLIVGLLVLFAGFWAAFALIFLDKSRATRCWLILPFTIAVYALVSHQYTDDQILAIAGFSELTLFKFLPVKEPYVKKMLRKRGSMALFFTTLITLGLVVLFVFVPGKRL